MVNHNPRPALTETSKMSPKFGTNLLLILTLFLGIVRSAEPAKLNAERTFRAAMDFLQPDRDRVIPDVYRARDGTTWLLCVDWGTEAPGDESTFARRLSSAGDHLGEDIVLSPTRQLAYACNALIVGTAPDGSLILDQEEVGGERERLVKIGLNGRVEKRDVPRHDDRQVFVDRDGIAHILVTRAGPGVENYLQVGANVRSLPVVKSLSYDRPFKQFASAPEYLRWEAGGEGAPFAMSFFSEGRGRILVAKANFGPTDSCFHLYRIDTKTLAVIDSGSADLSRDVYRTWSFPAYGPSDSAFWSRYLRPAIAGTKIVPAGESGYWVFTTTRTPGYWWRFTPVSATPAPTVVAYRFSRALKAVHPSSVTRAEVRPFTSAKQDGIVSVSGLGNGIPRYEHGTRVVPTNLKLDFVAFDRDGELYMQTYEDSLTSRPMH